MKQCEWSASLICADLWNLQRDLKTLQEFGMNYLHIDVMDGIFVPRLGMYPEMIQKMKEICSIPIEVHLMVENPEPYLRVFAEAGADVLTVHLEACRPNLLRTLEAIQSCGVKAGVALNPGTEFVELEYAVGYFDYLLLMGIHPGILGQKLKPWMMNKIKKYSRRNEYKIIIDGGVNFGNAASLFEAGADILVGGSQTIFHAASSLEENLLKLKKMEVCVKDEAKV